MECTISEKTSTRSGLQGGLMRVLPIVEAVTDAISSIPMLVYKYSTRDRVICVKCEAVSVYKWRYKIPMPRNNSKHHDANWYTNITHMIKYRYDNAKLPEDCLNIEMFTLLSSHKAAVTKLDTT